MARKLEIEGPYTTTERDAMVLRGLIDPYTIILNSTTAQFEFWDGAAWQTVPSNYPVFGSITITGAGIFGDSLADTNSFTGTVIINDQLQLNGARLRLTQGADVASANNLTLGTLGSTTEGNSFEVTGTTQINAITSANWSDGAVVTLLFTSTPTIKHNTAGGAGTLPIILAGAVDFVASAGATLTLIQGEIGGTDCWREISRTIPAATQTYTESNVTTDRTFNADATSLDEIADVLGSLLVDLRAKRIIA